MFCRKNTNQESTLIFFHIGKTGGSTLDMLMKRNFSQDSIIHANIGKNPQFLDEFKCLPKKRRAEIKYIGGHIPLGLHEYLPQPSSYITLLRDPVDRVISEYYYVLRRPDHPFYSKVTSRKMSLKDYVRCEVSPGVVSGQTRAISGVQGVDSMTGSGPISRDILDIAKKNLIEYFMLVGLTERFDESLILLKRALGWRMYDIFYTKKNGLLAIWCG